MLSIHNYNINVLSCENRITKLFKSILNQIFSNQKESKKIKSQNHTYYIY